jgi:hypothetical protein
MARGSRTKHEGSEYDDEDDVSIVLVPWSRGVLARRPALRHGSREARRAAF